MNSDMNKEWKNDPYWSRKDEELVPLADFSDLLTLHQTIYGIGVKPDSLLNGKNLELQCKSISKDNGIIFFVHQKQLEDSELTLQIDSSHVRQIGDEWFVVKDDKLKTLIELLKMTIDMAMDGANRESGNFDEDAPESPIAQEVPHWEDFESDGRTRPE